MNQERAIELAERARREGTPLVEGTTATFVWLGETAPLLAGDWNSFGRDSADTVLTERAPGVWTAEVELTADAYLEYVYFRDDKHVLDPFNLQHISNGMGAQNNFFAMPGWHETPLSAEQPGVPYGEIVAVEAESPFLVVGGRRTVHLYCPAAEGPFPLLLVYDGQDYLARARLTTIVDNLIAQGRIAPIALAMVDHSDQARFIEYCCSEATLGFVLEAVLPLAAQHLPLIDPAVQPGAYGVLGASMSGLMALYTGMRVPGIFGRALSQSGAFLFEYDGNPLVLHELIRCAPRHPLSIWMDCGRYEALLACNQAMRDLLTECGYDPQYREYPAGHNYTAWRNDLPRGLEALFPPR